MNIRYEIVSDEMTSVEKLIDSLECAKHNLAGHSSIKIERGTPLIDALSKAAYLAQAEANLAKALMWAEHIDDRYGRYAVDKD